MNAFVIRALALTLALAAIGGCSAPAYDDDRDNAAAAGQTESARERSSLDEFFHRNDESKAHNSAL